jgi:hypothetical protein
MWVQWLTPERQEAIVFVVVTLVFVFGIGGPVFRRLTRGVLNSASRALLKRGKVKWAMRLQFGGRRGCC